MKDLAGNNNLQLFTSKKRTRIKKPSGGNWWAFLIKNINH
jgi:hypothetical protein